ncbi:MAG: hypothetical protein ACI8QZ_001131 [Chlamydiales bacterium]|jgi:hypothetical protein
MIDESMGETGLRGRGRSGFLLCAFALVCIALPNRAQASGSSVASTTAGAEGALVFKALKYDFGRVFDIDDLVCNFAFENTGDATAVIRGVKASCGCTTPTLSRTSFEPGEVDALEARWDPKGIGRQSKTITVRSDALPLGMVTLTISAEISRFVQAEPGILKYGDIKMGQEHTGRVTFTCHDPNWEIQGVRTGNPNLRATLVEELSHGRKVVEITLGDGAPWGFLITKVYLDVLGRVTPDTGLVPHTAEFTVTGTLIGEISISAPMFAIGKITPGPFQAEIVLSRADGAAFEVVAVDVGPGAAPVGFEIRAEKSQEQGAFVQRLILSGDTGDYLGYLRGTVVFSTDVPGEGQRTLRFGGNVVSE